MNPRAVSAFMRALIERRPPRPVSFAKSSVRVARHQKFNAILNGNVLTYGPLQGAVRYKDIVLCVLTKAYGALQGAVSY